MAEVWMMSSSSSFNASEEEKQTRDPFNKTSLSVKEGNFTPFWIQSQAVTRAYSRSHKKTHRPFQASLCFVVH